MFDTRLLFDSYGWFMIGLIHQGLIVMLTILFEFYFDVLTYVFCFDVLRGLEL